MKVTASQLAAYVGKSERTIERWIASGKLQAASLPDGSYEVSGAIIENMSAHDDMAILQRLTAIEERLARIEHLLAGKQREKRPRHEPQPSSTPASYPDGLIPIRDAASLLAMSHPRLYEILVNDQNKEAIGLVTNPKNGLQHYAEPKGTRHERIRSLSSEQIAAVKAWRER